jgi:hypothetical protein
MTATVIPFPRWQRAAADLSAEALMRRVRFAARPACSRHAALPDVESYASRLLDAGKRPAHVIQAAHSLASQCGPQERA